MKESIKKAIDKEIILKDLAEKSKKHYRKMHIWAFISTILLFNVILIPLAYLLFPILSLSFILISTLICLVIAFFFVRMLSRGNKNKLLSIEIVISLSSGRSVIRLHTDSLQDTEGLLENIQKNLTIESYEICV